MLPTAEQIADTLLRHLEGCVLHPYQDSAGYWTIGIGCRYLLDGSTVTADTPPITNDQADALLDAALKGTMARVDAAVKVPLEPAQRAALYSLAYNIGCTNFERSRLLEALNAGHTLEAAGYFADWKMAGGKVDKGLVNRRAYERGVFLGNQTPSRMPSEGATATFVSVPVLPYRPAAKAPVAPPQAQEKDGTSSPRTAPSCPTADDLNASELKAIT
jgi:lysozyme